MNLWSMAPDGTDKQQHTQALSSDFELRYATLADISADTARICYQQGADLFAIDLTSSLEPSAAVLLPIVLSTGYELAADQVVSRPTRFFDALALSPEAKKVAMSLRGQLFVVPAGDGRTVDVTAPLG